MCNCKQFFHVSHSFHYNTIHLMQREAVLHVNCLLSCSWPHTNSVSLFPDVMHYLNYVRSLKEEEYCLFVKISCYFSLSVNENWNGYFGFLLLEKNRSEKWIYKVPWVVELIQWFPDTRRKSLLSFSLAFFNYILGLNPFSYLLQAVFILLLCLATALGCKTHFWAVSIHQNGVKIRHFCLG